MGSKCLQSLRYHKSASDVVFYRPKTTRADQICRPDPLSKEDATETSPRVRSEDTQKPCSVVAIDYLSADLLGESHGMHAGFVLGQVDHLAVGRLEVPF